MANKPNDSGEKPLLERYDGWLRDIFNISLVSEENRYERESVRIAAAAESSVFWQKYLSQKRNLADAYFARTTYNLFADSEKESILLKPWSSFLEKTYRANVTNNVNWPGEPDGGWMLPTNWYERTHDIARTSVVVKYLDGVTSVTDFFSSVATTEEVDNYSCTFEARETGYYAAHSRVGIDFRLLIEDWTEVATKGQFEIQVTTQLQEVIRRLTHNGYEVRRLQAVQSDVKWQWDYKAEEFKPNYLGHILHYLEGMIMEVRDKGREDV